MARSRKDIGSRLSRYPPDCSEVMARVGGRVSARRGAYMGARRRLFRWWTSWSLRSQKRNWPEIKSALQMTCTASFHCPLHIWVHIIDKLSNIDFNFSNILKNFNILISSSCRTWQFSFEILVLFLLLVHQPKWSLSSETQWGFSGRSGDIEV